MAISFKWDSMSFALAPDIQLTVCDGVASLICLRVESPITRTLSSASVILIVEKRFEIEMRCQCDTDIDLFFLLLPRFTVTHLSWDLSCGVTMGVLEGGVALVNVVNLVSSTCWVSLVWANEVIWSKLRRRDSITDILASRLASSLHLLQVLCPLKGVGESLNMLHSRQQTEVEQKAMAVGAN